MLGDLPQELLGSNPKYPPISNLDYLKVDKGEYDNYPSDNNPVRIQPKLSDLWDHNKKETGINLIPNQTSCHMRSADGPVVVEDIVREVKKAMMSGLKGSELAGHLRARFAAEDIVSAKEEMQKLSEEQGLLGNVYIDASAFINAKEAESFLAAHRKRLAQDIVLNDSKVSSEVIGFLANKFRKNVVAEISYDENLFKKYRAHLIDSGKIGKDFVVDSKETLRKAFLAVPAAPEPRAVTASTKKKVSKEVALQEVIQMGENKRAGHKAAEDEFTFRRVLPILRFAREQLSKGKTGGSLKELLRGKFASIDLNDAARYLAVVISSEVTPDHIDKLIISNKVSKMIGNDMMKLIKEYPLKVARFKEEKKAEKQIGVPGHFHVLSGKKAADSEASRSAVEALRKGFSPEQVKDKLLGRKLSNEDAESILLNAVKEFNEVPVGVKANTFKAQPKKKVVADLPERVALPDAKTIIPETQEFIDFYKGASFDIEIDEAPNTSLLDIGGLESKSGLDGGL